MFTATPLTEAAKLALAYLSAATIVASNTTDLQPPALTFNTFLPLNSPQLASRVQTKSGINHKRYLGRLDGRQDKTAKSGVRFNSLRSPFLGVAFRKLTPSVSPLQLLPVLRLIIIIITTIIIIIMLTIIIMIAITVRPLLTARVSSTQTRQLSPLANWRELEIHLLAPSSNNHQLFST